MIYLIIYIASVLYTAKVMYADLIRPRVETGSLVVYALHKQKEVRNDK